MKKFKVKSQLSSSESVNPDLDLRFFLMYSFDCC